MKETKRLPRLHLHPSGQRSTIWLPICQCGEERRGPEGGVCGKCALAIPGAKE